MSFEITREIGIDAAHRVTYHHSKCRSLHGHRYKIAASVSGGLATRGSTEGMAGGMDFGFLKEEMLATIDTRCDHALILWKKDPLLAKLLVKPQAWEEIDVSDGVAIGENLTICGQIYVMENVPTAEHLAAHWFHLLDPRISERTKGAAQLFRVRVHETPNCFVDAFGPSLERDHA